MDLGFLSITAVGFLCRQGRSGFGKSLYAFGVYSAALKRFLAVSWENMPQIIFWKKHFFLL